MEVFSGNDHLSERGKKSPLIRSSTARCEKSLKSLAGKVFPWAGVCIERGEREREREREEGCLSHYFQFAGGGGGLCCYVLVVSAFRACSTSSSHERVNSAATATAAFTTTMAGHSSSSSSDTQTHTGPHTQKGGIVLRS